MTWTDLIHSGIEENYRAADNLMAWSRTTTSAGSPPPARTG